VQNESDQDTDKPRRKDLRVITRKALLQLLEPLAGFVSDSGISAGELQSIFREAAVRSAIAKQMEVSQRVNISGIAATTGISRADISRILRSLEGSPDTTSESQQQSTNRILAAWYEDPKFTGPSGRPLDLAIYGDGLTFEILAKKYGRGIPTRALLDELVRVGAVELLATQKIRVKASMAVERGMSARVIKAFGEHASELLSTLLFNMRQPETPNFVASVSDTTVSSSSLPLVRKELSHKGADFLADAKDVLSRKPRSPASKRRNERSARVTMTIYYHESPIETGQRTSVKSRGKRRNFKRGP
jgi:uncharacterized protein YerC